jgi:hypothetical protein
LRARDNQIVFEAESAGAARDLLGQLEAVKAIVPVEIPDDGE